MNLCVIPARGGSKRIPRKNIRDFCGKPMIAWSIEAAQQAECFDQIMVSTDDPEIAEVALSWGAAVPFMRPPELADDFACTAAVVAHAVRCFLSNNTAPKAVCCLYATAPFVRSVELKQGLDLLHKSSPACYVFTATTYATPIQRAMKINPITERIQMWQPEDFIKRSQDLEETYHDAGQFYWGWPSTWLTEDNLFEGSQILVLPRWRVQDIDTEDDWVRAELMHKAWMAEGLNA